MPPLWTPPIDEMTMWIDPSDGDSVTLDPLVVNVTDLSGNSHDGTGSGTTKPSLSVAAINGLDALSCSGDWLEISGGGITCTTQVVTFSIFNRASAGVTACPLGSFDVGPGLNPFYWVSTDNSMYANYSATSLSLGTSTAFGNFLVTTIKNGTALTVRRNGIQLGTRPDGGVAGYPMNRIGRNVSYSHYGLLGEQISCDTIVDYEKYEGYLAHKWGITLYASHPYFASPPYDPFWCNFKGQSEL